MNSTTTLRELCAKVRCDARSGKAAQSFDTMDDWQKSAHNYRVTLRFERRSMTLDYSMGSTHTDEPDAEGVLKCLLSDASGADDSFESWCADYGYDSDSRKAERTYKQVQAQTAKLRRLLGDSFDEFMNAER